MKNLVECEVTEKNRANVEFGKPRQKADFVKLFEANEKKYGDVMFQAYKGWNSGHSSMDDCVLLVQSVIPEANEFTWSPFGFKLEFSDGKMHVYFKCTKNRMSLRLTELNAGTNKAKKCLCKYCGEPSGSKDPNVLCGECRSLFGHSLYSEL